MSKKIQDQFRWLPVYLVADDLRRSGLPEHRVRKFIRRAMRKTGGDRNATRDSV